VSQRQAYAARSVETYGALRLGEDGVLDIDAIAETYWQIHRASIALHRSAWAHEVDLRPFKEAF
jgi:hypothetical protein